jgi:hypothetical protein
LRWLWFWKFTDRPLGRTYLPCDNTDKGLFNASTFILVGKEGKANFWHSSWFNGVSPELIAPHLYNKAKRKKNTMHKATLNNTWISRISPLHTSDEVREYVALWENIRAIARYETTR